MHVMLRKCVFGEKRERIALCVFNFAVSFLMFHSFLSEHYSIDSFNVQYGYHQDAGNHIQNGRLVYSGVVYLLDLLGVSLTQNTLLWGLLYMFISAVCSTLLTVHIIKSNHVSTYNKFVALCVVDAGALIAFNNVFIAEWYQFVECLPMYAITISFSTMAALQTIDITDHNSTYHWLLALIFLIIAYNTYQVGVPLFFFFSLALLAAQIDERTDSIKDIFITLGKIISICCITVFSNLLLTKFVLAYTGRTGSRYEGLAIQNIAENVIRLLEKQKSIWFTANGMMSGPFLFIFLILELLLLFIGLAGIRSKVGSRFLFLIFLFIAAGMIGTFSTVLITDTFWVAPRSIVPLFALFLLLGVVVIRFQQKIQLIHVALSMAFLLIMVTQVGTYATDTIYSNRRDRDQVLMIQAEIERYEETSHQTVTQLAFIPDAGRQWRWDVAGEYQWDVCNKAIAVSWAQLPLFRFYTGRIYQSADVPVEIEEYSTAHDWNEYIPDEQLLFDEDTCYICLF